MLPVNIISRHVENNIVMEDMMYVYVRWEMLVCLYVTQKRRQNKKVITVFEF